MKVEDTNKVCDFQILFQITSRNVFAVARNGLPLLSRWRKRERTLGTKLICKVEDTNLWRQEDLK